MSSKGFFDEMSLSSEVKSTIVAQYFGAWAKVMNSKSRSSKLAYIDLFSGPGRYSDGSLSTPIRVLTQILSNNEFRNKFVSIFNDANPDFTNNLETEIKSLSNIDKLKYKPVILCSEVCDELAEQFEKMSMIPTLAFIDPWGYKGLTSRLINALIKDWGSDCIFFFNYNRINMGITNPIVVQHMNSIFGVERANELRDQVKYLTPDDRELTLLNALVGSLSDRRKNYVLPFRFERPDTGRTSHYLILVSKNALGYSIMKDIMWRYSSNYNDGVASFSYIPVNDSQLEFLFPYTKPLDDLGDELLQKFSGRTLMTKDIYSVHQAGTPFVLTNYKEALRRLEAEGKIVTSPPANSRRKFHEQVSFGDRVEVTFP